MQEITEEKANKILNMQYLIGNIPEDKMTDIEFRANAIFFIKQNGYFDYTEFCLWRIN